MLSLLLLFFVSGYAQDTKLTIYCTNDIHGHVLKEKRDSIIDITYIASLKKNSQNPCLLVDAGDLAYGMPIADSAYISDLADLLNVAGYDAATLGNHDFDGGIKELESRITKSKFPYVSANIFKHETSQYYLSNFRKINGSGNYTIKEINGIKVGIFGLTTAKAECARTKEFIDFKGNDSDTAYIAIANKEVKKLKERKKADIVIAICHLGKPNYTDSIMKRINGLDAIIDGDSHQEYVDFYNHDKRVLIQAGTGAQKVGEIILNINKKKEITNINARLLSFSDVRNIKIDKNIAQKEKKLRQTLEQKYGTLPLRLKEPFWGNSVTYLNPLANPSIVDVEPCRLTQTMLGQLWCYIMLRSYAYRNYKDPDLDNAMKPLVILKNGGSLRTGLPEGEVTGTDLFQMCPNNAEVVSVQVRYKTLNRILSYSLAKSVGYNEMNDIRVSKRQRSGAFLQWMGVKADWVSEPVINAISDKSFSASGDTPESKTVFSLFNSYCPRAEIPIKPYNKTDICTLITTRYVLNDTTSYGGKIEIIGTPDVLGNELNLMNSFFSNYTESNQSPLAWTLKDNLKRYKLEINGNVNEGFQYTPNLLLQYDGLVEGDIRYTVIYQKGRLKKEHKYIDYIKNGEIFTPGNKYIGPVIVKLECDAKVRTRDGKTISRNLYGSTYLDPMIGCGDAFPAVIKLRER